MRNTVSVLLTCVLLLSAGCGNEPAASDDQAAGASEEVQQEGAVVTSTPEDGVVGRWRDNKSNPIFHSNLVIAAEDGQYYLEHQFDDGSSRRTNLIEKESPLGRRFDPDSVFITRDSWIIDPNGDLLLQFDNETTAKLDKTE